MIKAEWTSNDALSAEQVTQTNASNTLNALDCISRQAAIETAVRAAIDWHRLANPQYSIAYCIGEAMRALPSAQPERKRGKWIPKEDRAKQEVFICSVCGRWAYSPWVGSRKNPKPNWCKYLFCPNCGAEMRGEQDG